MNYVHAHEFLAIQDFITAAKLHFEANPKNNSFYSSEIKAGCYFAMRWGLDKDSILVFKLSDDMEPLVIGNIIGSN